MNHYLEAFDRTIARLSQPGEIFIRGGDNISCTEVESAFYNYSDIKEVSVFGLSDNL
ncbi:MAG: hypothetical protein P8J18_10190 [Halieaceae bacterium]|nr:hypothetical protein [Halieaceae bacterium]